MWGSWSAVLAKLMFRKKLIIRTGYMLSLNFMKEHPNNRLEFVMKFIEFISFKNADGIITTSQSNLKFIEYNYKPKGKHVLILNYIEPDIFKPLNETKIRNSICFIGRLSKEKNLFNLLKALKDLPYSLSIIGTGELYENLRDYADKYNFNLTFFGNIPNHQLPKILNQHEVFILPSLYENMPKTLLEAMSCGMPVIGTNVKGINEVISDGVNGLLCDTDSYSIKKTIRTLFGDKKLMIELGINARKTIVEDYNLKKLSSKEIKLIDELLIEKS